MNTDGSESIDGGSASEQTRILPSAESGGVKTLLATIGDSEQSLNRMSTPQLQQAAAEVADRPEAAAALRTLATGKVPPPPDDEEDSASAVDVFLDQLRDRTDEIQLRYIIGRGGQGEVWEALQANLGRAVAVKKITATGATEVEFFREAITSAQLDHPNIVPIYDLGKIRVRDTVVPCLTMKQVRGSSWRTILKQERASPDFKLSEIIPRNLPILIAVINAISYAHSKGVIHRDLKPAQVMVGKFGEVFLLDWGLAVCLDRTPLGEETPREVDRRKLCTMETASNPAGSPAYMAPEQARMNTDGLGYHTDIYLIGAILYELVMGFAPHAADTVGDALDLAIRNSYLPLLPQTPPVLATLINRCLATAPGDRPASAIEVREELERYLSGAGKRERAVGLVQSVLQKTAHTNYDQLSACSRRLAEAAQLWPEYEELPPARRHLLRRFAEVATSKGDFLLARLQADRIDDTALADEVRRTIDSAQEEAAARLPHPPLLTRGRIGVFLLGSVLIAAAMWSFVQVGIEGIRREVYLKVEAISAAAARQVSAADLRAVDKDRDQYTGTFQRVFNQLTFYRLTNDDVRYIYTLKPNFIKGPNKWITLVDADPLSVDIDGDGKISNDEQGAPPGNPYPYGTEVMREAFETKTTRSSYLKDSWGSFYSGFTPVLDPRTQEPVALLGVDIPVERFEGKLLTVQRTGLAIALLLELMLIATCWAYFEARRSLARVRQLEDALRKQNSELRGGGVFLG